MGPKRSTKKRWTEKSKSRRDHLVRNEGKIIESEFLSVAGHCATIIQEGLASFRVSFEFEKETENNLQDVWNGH